MATGRGGERRSAMDGQLQDAGPENRQLFSSPCWVAMDDRSTSRTDGRKTAAMAKSSKSRGKGMLFTPFSAVSQLLPVSRRHLYALYFLIIPDFKTFWTLPGTFPKTSGSRILLPVQHPRPKMECQQVRFTSASDYIPPVPL